MHPLKSHLLTLLPFLPLTLSAPIQLTQPSLPLSPTLQNILLDTTSSPLYNYPTSLTRDIIPKPIHSHNDYWRPIPFYTALSLGCISIEADVSLFNSTLYVGHENAALTPDRTLDALYIQPILEVLQGNNPRTAFTKGASEPNGVYDTSSGQTLYLFIDLKTSGEATWPYVVEALAPLRDGGYLTTYNGTEGGVTGGAVTVIGTGNTPASNFSDTSEKRDYFLDANLALLDTSQGNITSDISPVASTQFSRYIGEISTLSNDTSADTGVAGFNSTQLQTLRSQIATAEERGIKARYWDTPAWPVSVRNQVWTVLQREGVGLLNADDLRAAAGVVGWTDGMW